MNKKWIGLLAAFGLLMAGCLNLGTLKGSDSADNKGSFVVDIPGEPIPIPISELSAAPAEYSGDYLQVTGNFMALPEIGCDTKPRQSPATWALADENTNILAAGIAEQWSTAPLDSVKITVTGRWQQWIGLTGCGRQSTPAEVWYLEVTNIVSPNPIAFVSTLPASVDQQPVEQETSATATLEDPSLTSTVPLSTMSSTASPEATTVLTTVPTAAPTQVAGTDPVPGETPSTVPSPTPPAATSNAATPLPSSTPPSGSPTAVPTEATAAVTVPPTVPPLATSTLPAPIVQDQIELDVSSIETGFLEPNEIHRWPMTISDTNVITVNVASEIGLDVSVKVSDSSGNILAQQDTATGNEPEILAGVVLPAAGAYYILIEPSSSLPGNYAILVNDFESYPFIFQGTLDYGDSANGSLASLSDHFWHFSGTAGERMTVVVTPGGNYDLFLRLFGPDGILLIEFHDDNGSGEEEAIVSFEFPGTGLYSLLVGEFTFQPAEYEVVLTQG